MSSSEFDVTGKVALVTGASSGFGVHFANLLAQNGAKVVVGARRKDKLDALVKNIRAAGGEALAVSLDVTKEDSIKAAFDAAEQTFGVVDIVSNNAGVADTKAAVDTELESWDFVLDTNLKGAWMVAREAGMRMIQAGKQGSIVNTASILGLRTARGQVSYATSKAAVVQLTRTLALEWARKKIRVNALCPGYFLTEINESYFATQAGQDYIKTMPMARLGEMEEISAPFMLLASDAGSFVNGVALPVDGAHSLGHM